ncbi:expressed unknown protein [Seminavis robusta]|uniref:Uncharacterized protein n=1 Tax=Seminavis robusta TaxID=568900 RepID=A0A9N8DHQ6_9STRA|nr:expressed unknown protein [Seminavis robusta]|eukprot:Sro127_g060870.1 n/a (481) ;mRNA; r:68486-69928
MASNADIRRLVLNDERLSTLILTFDHTLNIPQLQYALSLNGTVKEIVVYTDETFLPRFPMTEIRGLFEVLGGIPSLQRICFNSRSGFDGVISVQALIHVLGRASRLASFAVSDLKLEGTEQDWSQFAEQLQRSVYLKSFCIIECELSAPSAAAAAEGGAPAALMPPRGGVNGIGGSKTPLDPMVMVLSILPCMEKVYLHSTRTGGLGEISSQAVGALLLSASLKVLKIRDFDLGADTIKAMARMLQVNPVLKDLKVGTMVDFQMASAVAFATMLEHNSGLECLEVGLSKMISDECAATLAKSLKVNKGLKSFALIAEDSGGNGMMMTQKVSKPCKDAFVDMLRSNYVIENFVLFQRFPVKPEFKLFVTLNKLGRGRLLQAQETNLEQWIQALATVNDDLDALFYYMSINPDLCKLALQRMNAKTNALRPKKRQKIAAGLPAITNAAIANAAAIANLGVAAPAAGAPGAVTGPSGSGVYMW